MQVDSMQVRALSRTPGTLSYQLWARKVLYSNVASTSPPYDTWTYVKLATTSGDKIQWLWFDGRLVIDDLKITRASDSTAPCSPTGDAYLDDTANRATMDSAFQQSQPTAPQGTRKEHYVAAYRYADGHIENVTYEPPGATDCSIPSDWSPANIPGTEIVWVMHSHPYTYGEVVTKCGGKTYSPARTYRAGASATDWTWLDNMNGLKAAEGKPPVPMYIYDKLTVYRMEPNPTGQSLNRFTTYNRSNRYCHWY